MSRGRLQVEESPIHCIFFSEFDHIAGPKITYQVPNDFLSKEIFGSLKSYIIPKSELQGKLMSVNESRNKIIGFPIVIENVKYPRNNLIFNLCFVCDSSLRTVQYEPLVRKLANYLVKLELEDEFLYKNESKARLPEIMEQMKNELNTKGYCSIYINESNTIYLKVIRINPTPPEVEDHEVPIFTQNKMPVMPSEWDLTTQQILPYIDGFRHVAKIAAEADVEIRLVKACIRNLVYYEVVTLIPIFMYSNAYMPTPKLNQLVENAKSKDECIKYVARQGCHSPNFRSVFLLYSALCPGTTVKNLCVRYNPRALGVDERKLIQFGLMRGMIRRLQKYPIHVPSDQPGYIRQKSLLKYFNGCHSYDEICCKTGLSYQDLDDKVERDPNVVVCWK